MTMADPLDLEAARAARARRKAEAQAKANGHGSDGWQGELAFGITGKPLATLSNAVIALANAPEWRGVFAWNDFTSRVEVMGQIPGAELYAGTRELSDVDISTATLWLQRAAITLQSKVTAEAIQVVADRSHFHPVRDYLGSLEWDHVPRIDLWLVDHLGAEDTPLHRAFGARWLISLVARVYEPGCQADCALIFESRQGLGKSTLLRTLGGPWFTDHLPDLTNKDAMQQIQGVWICEISELDSMRRAETNRIKSFLSARVDRFRPPFGRLPANFPRQCGFAGTVNPGAGGYLRDETGARRFWTVACAENEIWGSEQRVDVASLSAVRNQLWAEAVHRYRSGERWFLDTNELENAQAEAADERRVEDPRERTIATFIRGRDWVRMDEILGPDCLKVPIERWNRSLETEIGFVMSALKWRRKLVRVGKAREYRYVPRP